MENMIDITGADLVKVAQAAYALSQPQGMGFLHARDGELSQEDAEALVLRERAGGRVKLGMDYVHGRAVKLTVLSDDDGKLWISNRWYDHNPHQLQQLLTNIGRADKIDEVRND